MITTKADAVFEELDPAYDFIIANFGLFNVPPVTVINSAPMSGYQFAHATVQADLHDY